MRTMHSTSCGLAPLRASHRVAFATAWLGCTVLLSPASAANVPPVLGVELDQQVNEGQLLDLSGTGGARPLDLFVDPDLADSHVATVHWGDGTPTQMATVFPGARALGGSYYYADNGTYTVTVTVADSAGGSDSDTFRVTVKNVNPTLGVTPSPTAIGVGQSVSFNAAFSDPGFDNPLNTPNSAESFRYYLSWGDGLGTIATQGVADINGGPGVASTGVFSGSHAYATDGAYTVTVRLADDDMGAYDDSARFLTGGRDSDYVEQTFTVAVSPIPEPAAIVLTLIGLACLLAQRRRHYRHQRSYCAGIGGLNCDSKGL